MKYYGAPNTKTPYCTEVGNIRIAPYVFIVVLDKQLVYSRCLPIHKMPYTRYYEQKIFGRQEPIF